MPESPMKNPLTGIGGPQPDLSSQKQYEVQPEVAKDISNTSETEASNSTQAEKEIAEQIFKLIP